MTVNHVLAVILRHFSRANYVKQTEGRPTVSATNSTKKSFRRRMTRYLGRAILSNFFLKTDPHPSFHYSSCATLHGHLSNSWLRYKLRTKDIH